MPLPEIPTPFNIPNVLHVLPSLGQWYHTQISRLAPGDETALRRLGAILDSWNIILPTLLTELIFHLVILLSLEPNSKAVFSFLSLISTRR